MPAVYDNWERLVGAVLSREDLRRSGMRTPSEISSLSARSSFSFISPFNYWVNSSPFTYDQILRATDSFSNLMYFGVSGDLFSGVLDGGVRVVVKKVYSSSAAQLSFLMSEMDFFARVSHPNFVPLLGYCMENRNHRFVVYKYMENGDLFSFLYKNWGSADRQPQQLEWRTRLKIATGVARALCHLHHECLPPLVYRNVEASSIVIDENYDGYLRRVFQVCMENENRKQSKISNLLRFSKGSEEHASDSLNATRAYDTYCFGKVLLQLVTGIPVLIDENNSSAPNSMMNILPYITFYDEGLFVNIMDPYLKDGHLFNEKWGVAVVAKACLCPEPSKRPLMKNVLKVLEEFNLEELSTFVISPSSDTPDTFSADWWHALWDGQNSPPNVIWDVPSLTAFSFAELKAATENFRPDLCVGEGGFGRVFRGHLQKSASNSKTPSLIAVKRCDHESLQGFEEWQTEIRILGNLSHPNLIKLHGYCNEDKELLLVYEYMHKGRLDNYLFGSEGGSNIQPLSWHIRLKVLMGAARALAYLHGIERKAVFRDVKPSSIFLDSSYNPKLSDFALAKMGPPGNEPLIGTQGNAAPEYVATGRLYLKSEVYGFGVLIVEVLTGLRSRDTTRSGDHYLVNYLQKLKEIMDPRLEGEYSVKGAFRMAQLALTCLDQQAKNRPSMKQVMETLLEIASFMEK